jgi:hypothetical protein
MITLRSQADTRHAIHMGVNNSDSCGVTGVIHHFKVANTGSKVIGHSTADLVHRLVLITLKVAKKTLNTWPSREAVPLA